MKTYDCIVIGGGAAGLMAGVNLARNGKQVLLLEKMERCGRKMLICGKGRCNVTNYCEVEDFLPAIKHNKKFMFSALYTYTPFMAMDFFEGEGVPLKVERGNRVFPVSDCSADVVNALVNAFVKGGGNLRLNTTVEDILFQENEVTGVLLKGGETLATTKVIIATGGVSYPKTGSQGDGYKFAKKMGHSIITPKPALIPIELEGSEHKELQGLSLKHVVLQVKEKKQGKLVYQEQGEMMFTHFGVSGPLVLRASCYMDGTNPQNYELSIDFKPALTSEELDRRLLRDFAHYTNKNFINIFPELLPKKLIPVFLKRLGIPEEKKVHQITALERETLLQLLKNFSLTMKGFRPVTDAIVTAGGINVQEINPSTMESKLTKGLYFAGEVMDVDAYTGGYNLQMAYSSGILASNHILED